MSIADVFWLSCLLDHQVAIRTSIAILFFVLVFVVSAVMFVGFHDARIGMLSSVTAIVSAVGTVSTVVLAWRGSQQIIKPNGASRRCFVSKKV
jgi:hypothetical protein